jgi:hypothetical protein
VTTPQHQEGTPSNTWGFVSQRFATFDTVLRPLTEPRRTQRGPPLPTGQEPSPSDTMVRCDVTSQVGASAACVMLAISWLTGRSRSPGNYPAVDEDPLGRNVFDLAVATLRHVLFAGVAVLELARLVNGHELTS